MWLFVEINLNSLHPRMICAKWVEIGPVILEKIFLISTFHFCQFTNIFLWKRAGSFIEKKLKPFHQGCFTLSLVEIAQVVLKKKKIFNYHQCIFAIS